MYERMWHLFCLIREDYLKHYHKRSNVESTFSAVKRKFGEMVRSKTDTAQRNETLCKFVALNVCRIHLGTCPIDSPEIAPARSPTVIDGPRL